MSNKQVASKAGWSLTEHAAACGYSRSYYWALPPNRRPQSVHITPRKLVITESPADYLKRLSRESASA
jgi:hypothetical protein